MIRTILIDDESPARDELRYLLKRYSSIKIVGEADNATEAIDLITKTLPDLAFLDIQMRGLSGLELAKIINNISPQTRIIFASAYDDYALKAFELNASDYIVKPIEEERLELAIQHATHDIESNASLNTAQQSPIPIDTKPSMPSLATSTATKAGSMIPSLQQKLGVSREGHIVLIDISSIFYITGESGRLDVYTASGTYESYKTLTDLQERLFSTGLYRVHRSYIVNLAMVKEVIPWFKGTYWLRLPAGKQPGSSELVDIPVSKSQIKRIKQLLGLT